MIFYFYDGINSVRYVQVHGQRSFFKRFFTLLPEFVGKGGLIPEMVFQFDRFLKICVKSLLFLIFSIEC